MCFEDPKWIKYSHKTKGYWKLKIGRFTGEVIDRSSNNEGFVGYVNGERATQKFQSTLKRAQGIVVLAIRAECKNVMVLTEDMFKY